MSFLVAIKKIFSFNKNPHFCRICVKEIIDDDYLILSMAEDDDFYFHKKCYVSSGLRKR